MAARARVLILGSGFAAAPVRVRPDAGGDYRVGSGMHALSGMLAE